MDTNNKKLTTTNGYEVAYKPYLTGRQLEQAVQVQAATEDDRKRLMGHEVIKMAVVSVTNPHGEITEGDEKKILDAVLDMPVTDYADVQETIGELVAGKKKEQTTPRT